MGEKERRGSKVDIHTYNLNEWRKVNTESKKDIKDKKTERFEIWDIKDNCLVNQMFKREVKTNQIIKIRVCNLGILKV